MNAINPATNEVPLIRKWQSEGVFLGTKRNSCHVEIAKRQGFTAHVGITTTVISLFYSKSPAKADPTSYMSCHLRSPLIISWLFVCLFFFFCSRNCRACCSRYQTSFSPSSPCQRGEWRSTPRDENMLAGDSRRQTWLLGDTKPTEETTWRKVRKNWLYILRVLIPQTLWFAVKKMTYIYTY